MRSLSFVLVAALGVVACTGTIGDALTGGGPGGADAGGGVSPAGDPGITAACSTTYAPGHVSIHRLTNSEYNNTVRDLLFSKLAPADSFDPSPAGLSGFQNDSDGLTISDDLVAAYYTASEQLAAELLASKGAPNGAYAKIVTCAPSAACAQATVKALAARAYRRPPTDAEIATLMGVYNADTDFDTGIGDVVIAILNNPKFLYVTILNPQANVAGAEYALDPYALAARLSYALWQTMPDDELTGLAQSGKIAEPGTMHDQIVRMLKDPRVASFLTSLRDDWAGLRALADPAGKLVGLDDGVRASMVKEVDLFLANLVASDASVEDVVSGDYAFVDANLAKVYGVPFTGSDPTAFVKVSSPANRRGIVTSAAVLTATAGDVAYTHPVKRGKWVTNQVLCTPPAPPPPGVPPFDPTAGGGTPRQSLEQHAKNPACSGCHNVMDAVGLGLENYDPFGRWRDAYPGGVGPVDPSGTLPDGTAFKTPVEMYSDIAQEDATKACLARHVLAYVLTRAMTSTDDQCVSKAIGTMSVTRTGTFSDLLTKIAGSRQFLMQTGEAP